MKKILIALTLFAVAAFASAGSFTVYGALGDLTFTPQADAAVFGGAELGFSVSPAVDVLVGAATDLQTANVYTGLSVDLPRNPDTDATAFLAVRAGVGAPLDFSDVYALGTATLGVRGDNGFVLEGGVLYRSDFSFSAGTFVPVVLLGYGLSW